MGLFSNLFGGRSSYKGAIQRMEQGYKEARTYADEQYGKIIDQFLQERTNNAEVYSQAYNSAVNQYASVMAQSREAFKESSREAYQTLAAGRDASLQLLRQQTEQAVGRTTARSAFMGLSNTTFGQQQIEAVSMQGALQAAALNEQYAQTLASAQQAQANALAQMEQQAAQSMFAAGLGSAQYQSQQYQQYTTAAQGARAGQLQAGLQLRTRPVETRYQAEINQALLDMQSGSAFGGALLGSAIGALGEGLGSAFGGPMGGQIGRQAGNQISAPFVAGA